MNLMRTQYIENDFMRYQTGYHILLSRLFDKKRLFVLFVAALQSGLVQIICCAVVFVSVIGYVTVINYSMVYGASLKQTQNEIKLIETSVLQKEIFLANARTTASLKKQKEIVVMENVDNIYYISPNMSVAEASGVQAIR